MPHEIRITLTDSLLDALQANREVRLTVEADDGAQAAKPSQLRRTRGKHGRVAREGSLPQRITDWAVKRGEPFRTDDLIEAFAVRRPHASMLLTTLVKRGAIRRVSRGLYEA